MSDPRQPETRTALIAGISCYAMWGVIPLVFQAMGRTGADAWEIMAHRMVWSLLLAVVLALALGRMGAVRQVLANRRAMGWLALSAVLIAVNWTTYVFAVNGGRTLDASLGYYLNPLLNMAAGAWLFKERIRRLGLVAIGLAAVGVALQAVALGHLPWISLLLAFSFCGYGIIRKRVEADALPGLLIECLLLFAPAALWLGWLAAHNQSHFGTSLSNSLWLMLAGPATVVPMVLFAWAARRMPYSTMGFLQFLAPSMVFVIGVLQGEPMSWLRGISFGFIWAGALVFAMAALVASRRARTRSEAPPVPPAECGIADDIEPRP